MVSRGEKRSFSSEEKKETRDETDTTRLVQCGPEHTGDRKSSSAACFACEVTNSSSKQQLISDDQVICLAILTEKNDAA